MTWLATKEAAELLGYSERAIRNKAKNGEYTYRYIPSSTGQGGKKMEILLESLPEQAQKAYLNKNGECQTVFNTDFISTSSQKEKGYLRSEAVRKYKKFLGQCKKEGMKKKTEIMPLFIRQWNGEHPDFQITQRALYDWMNKSKSGQPEKLIDKRGGYNRGQSSIPKPYADLFDSLYLQQSKPSIESCFREVQIKANLNGDSIPGIKAFRNHVRNLNKAVVILAREGQKAFDDKCMTYTERDYSQLKPNDIWVADHHIWDIFVRVPDSKGGWKLERPWGSYWMDMRTRKIVSSIIRTESPNADIVLCSFGLGVEHFGIPKAVQLDNGKDYRAKDLFGPKDKYIVSEDEKNRIFNSLAFNLKIDTHFAIPYNAKSKPIERVFNTFESQLGKKYSSYAGSNAKQRPEDLKDLDIMSIITLENFIEQHNRYVYEIYNETRHSGAGMNGMSPNQAYADIPFTIRRAPKEVLYFSLMRVKEPRTVQRNGVTFNGIHFYNQDCINHLGKKVIAKYDPREPEVLYIFDENENFLFEANKVQKRNWDASPEDYQAESQRKKIVRQLTLNSYTADNVVRNPEAVGERLKLQAAGIEKAEVAKPKTVEPVRNEKLEESVRKISMSDIERNYEDVIKRNKARTEAESGRQKEYTDKFKSKFLDRGYKQQA